jgi:cytochrome b pre-mRNA-processing protein 3
LVSPVQLRPLEVFLASAHKRAIEAAAAGLYVRVVEQARQPLFYLGLGVPDTPDGRFDMIALHAALLLRRLRRERERTEAVSQAVFDLMFADMDQNLREMGVGDLAVGKRIKAMAQGFYGRLAAYDVGLAAEGDEVLADALARNVFRHRPPGEGDARGLAAYMRRQTEALDAQPVEALLAGDVHFAAPAANEEVTDHARGQPA